MNEEQIIEKLGLEKHPEGGWYKETFLSKVPSFGLPRWVTSKILALLF